jgi:transcriptional regulator with XRE-family HTH domain
MSTHGTYSMYTRGGCRCQDCRDATAAYQRRYRRECAQRRWGAAESWLVGAQPVREHIAMLRAHGLGWQRIATLAEVPRVTVSRLSGHGDPRRPQRRLARTSAERILAVTIDDAAGRALVPSGPTVRRLQALAAAGWTLQALADRLGVWRQHVSVVQSGDRELVRADTARAVARVYRDLHMTPGPNRHTAARARRRGWLPPLAWDDIDAGVVGDTAQWVGCQMCDDVAAALAAGATPDQAARVMSDAQLAHSRRSTLSKHLHAHARWDLLEAVGLTEVAA